MDAPKLRAMLRRELPRSAAGAVAASLVPSLFQAHQTAEAMRPVLDAVAAMAPKIFMNAALSAIIPALMLLRHYRRHELAFRIGSSRIVLGLALLGAAAALATTLTIAVICFAAWMSGRDFVSSGGATLILLAQSVPVAVLLTSAAMIGGSRYFEH